MSKAEQVALLKADTEHLLRRVRCVGERLYALALAIVGAVVGWFQGHGERKQLEKDVKNLEWGVEYFRE